MTDPDPPYARLRSLADELARVREEAARRAADLEKARDEEIVRVIGDQPSYGVIAATARAARISRQRLDTIRRIADAKRDPKS